jgi:hypothetical protein
MIKIRSMLEVQGPRSFMRSEKTGYVDSCLFSWHLDIYEYLADRATTQVVCGPLLTLED